MTYPITELVSRIVQQKNLSVRFIARTVGYEDLEKGCSAFEEFLTGDLDYYLFVNNIYKALGVDKKVVDEAVRETVKIKKAAFRQKHLQEKRFICPALYVCTVERRNDRRFNRSLSKYLSLGKAFLYISPEEKKAHIKKTIQEHQQIYYSFAAYDDKLLYYVLSETYNDTPKDRTVYDLNGQIISDISPEKRIFPFGNIEKELKIRGEIDEDYEQAYREKHTIIYGLKKEIIPALFIHTDNRERPNYASLSVKSKSVIIRLPQKLSQMSEPEKSKLIKESILKLMQQSKGILPHYGKITHFVLSDKLYDSPEERTAYNVEGNPIKLPPGKKDFFIAGKMFKV